MQYKDLRLGFALQTDRFGSQVGRQVGFRNRPAQGFQEPILLGGRHRDAFETQQGAVDRSERQLRQLHPFQLVEQGRGCQRAAVRAMTQLQGHPKAKLAWSELIPSRQKEILRYFAGLKSETARARNYAKAMRVLNGAKERFMARDWNGPSGQDRLKVEVGKG